MNKGCQFNDLARMVFEAIEAKRETGEVVKLPRLTMADYQLILTEFLEQLTRAIKDNGQKVSLKRFGKIWYKHFPQRDGFNFRTKEKITIAARDRIHVKPGQEWLQVHPITTTETPA